MLKSGAILIQFVFILLIVFTYAFFEEEKNFDYYLSIIVVLQFLWQTVDIYTKKGTVMSVIFLFLLAAFLFNGGEFIVKIFNPRTFVLMEPIQDESIRKKALLLIALSFSFIYFGAISFLRKPTSSTILELKQKDILIFRRIGLTLLLISIGFQFDYLFKTLKVAMESGYYSIYSLEKGVGVNAIPKILRDFYVPSILILFWCDVKLKKKTSGIWIILLFFYSIMLFMIGYRGHAIMPILGFAFLYDKQYRKINTKKVAIIGLFFLFVVFPLIKNFRNAPESATVGDLVKYTIESVQEMAILREMGGSAKTVGYTMELVPIVRDYDYGTGYLWATTSLLPNFFNEEVHPAITHANYAQWLTREINPWAAETGGGVGFSFIAEAYINFAYFGLIFLFFLGRSLVKLEKLADTKSIYIIVLSCFLSFFLMYSRGQFLDMTRSFVWYSLGPYLLFLFFRRNSPQLIYK